MAAELVGQVPIPFPFAQILVNRAWRDVQREYLWSHLWADFLIPTPQSVSSGTVALTLGSTQVVGDALAAAAWNAMGLVIPITTRQFRVGQGSIYNISAFDSVNTLILDRAWVDTTAGAGQGYQIYKLYYATPYIDFIWFDTIRDPITGYTLSTTKTRQEADDQDPMRLAYTLPAAVLPYKINQVAGAFYGYPMVELWPAPLNGYTYSCEGFRAGVNFDNTVPGISDSVVLPLDEDVIIEMAKMYAYEWAMANPDKAGKGDFQYLYGAAKKRYGELVNSYILRDESFSKRHTIPYAETRGRLDIPWVSQRANIAVFS